MSLDPHGGESDVGLGGGGELEGVDGDREAGLRVKRGGGSAQRIGAFKRQLHLPHLQLAGASAERAAAAAYKAGERDRAQVHLWLRGLCRRRRAAGAAAERGRRHGHLEPACAKGGCSAGARAEDGQLEGHTVDRWLGHGRDEPRGCGRACSHRHAARVAVVHRACGRIEGIGGCAEEAVAGKVCLGGGLGRKGREAEEIRLHPHAPRARLEQQ